MQLNRRPKLTSLLAEAMGWLSVLSTVILIILAIKELA